MSLGWGRGGAHLQGLPGSPANPRAALTGWVFRRSLCFHVTFNMVQGTEEPEPCNRWPDWQEDGQAWGQKGGGWTLGSQAG